MGGLLSSGSSASTSVLSGSRSSASGGALLLRSGDGSTDGCLLEFKTEEAA